MILWKNIKYHFFEMIPENHELRKASRQKAFQYFKAEKFYVHPHYTSNSVYNRHKLNYDIMLVKLKSRTEWGKTPQTYGRQITYSKWRFTKYVAPICLSDKSIPLRRQQCWITGSAGDGNRETVDGLEEAPVFMNTPDCKESQVEKKLPREVRDTLTCSGQRIEPDHFESKIFAQSRLGKHSAVACETDSGGPLVCRENSNSPFFLEGIISYG